MNYHDLIDRLRSRSFSSKSRDPLAEEAANAIEVLSMLREDDGRAVSIMLEECSQMRELCANGRYLTKDEERVLERLAKATLAKSVLISEAEAKAIASVLRRFSLQGDEGTPVACNSCLDGCEDRQSTSLGLPALGDGQGSGQSI